MKKIKLIWNFNGIDSYKAAEHFHIHLIDFLKNRQILKYTSKVEFVNEFHAINFLIIEEVHVNLIKNALKPNKAYMIE